MVLSFIFKNHLDQVNPETKAKSWCGCVDNISCGDAVLVLFGGSITVFRTPPMSPSMYKIYQRYQISLCPKITSLQNFSCFAKSKRLPTYHHLSFKSKVINAIKILQFLVDLPLAVSLNIPVLFH